MAGSLGVSSLVCLLNNGEGGNTETSQSLLGPFWRLNSPRVDNGGSIVRSDTPGDPLFVTARVVDRAGAPIAGAEVDIWHASPIGLYENQDPDQADMNLRGKFTTDAEGRFWFRTVKMVGYPLPTDGVVGRLLRAQNRQPNRPAHLHALIVKPGYKVLISQVYDPARPEPARRPAVRRDARAAGRLRQARRAAPDRTRDRAAVVCARLHLCDGAGGDGAAESADPMTGPEPPPPPRPIPPAHPGDRGEADGATPSACGASPCPNFQSSPSS